MGTRRASSRPYRVANSAVCHYCGGHATTEDHIVPKCILPRPQSRLPYWFRSHNVVPCCRTCNNKKGYYRSDCPCALCEWAWRTAKAIFLPLDYETPKRIRLVTEPRYSLIA